MAEYLRVFRHVGFFCFRSRYRDKPTQDELNGQTESTVVQQLAEAATTFQLQQTGHVPSDVTVVIEKDTLVVTLHERSSPAELALGQ